MKKREIVARICAFTLAASLIAADALPAFAAAVPEELVLNRMQTEEENFSDEAVASTEDTEAENIAETEMVREIEPESETEMPNVTETEPEMFPVPATGENQETIPDKQENNDGLIYVNDALYNGYYMDGAGDFYIVSNGAAEPVNGMVSEGTKYYSLNDSGMMTLLKQTVFVSGKAYTGYYMDNYDLDEYLKDGMDVKISYSFSIEVQCDGETNACETEAETVGDVLAELKITLGEDDRVTPAATEKVTEGMKIVVNRVTFDTVAETEEIAYETSYENDSSMAKGQEQVSTKGENGEKEVTYQVTYVDGVEESREATGETVTKEPVNEVVKVGTKEESSSGGSGRTVVSKKQFDDCDGSGHGYYEITYSDGSVEYEEY